MMNLLRILLALAGFTSISTAQAQPFDLPQHAKAQKTLQKKGMYVLAGWAGANILGGAILTGQTSGTAQHFHRMNAYWNLVNGTLAGTALLRLSKTQQAESFASVYKQQQSLEKIFLFNAGLDVAYIAGGLYLNERSRRTNSQKLKGYGNSVVLQGGFLLLFDGVMYSLLHANGKHMNTLLEKVQLNTNGTGLSIVVKL